MYILGPPTLLLRHRRLSNLLPLSLHKKKKKWAMWRRARTTLTLHKTHSQAREGAVNSARQAQSILLQLHDPFAQTKYKALSHESEQ